MQSGISSKFLYVSGLPAQRARPLHQKQITRQSNDLSTFKMSTLLSCRSQFPHQYILNIGHVLYPRPGSNRHALLEHGILSPTCLPIPPLGHVSLIFRSTVISFTTCFHTKWSDYFHHSYRQPSSFHRRSTSRVHSDDRFSIFFPFGNLLLMSKRLSDIVALGTCAP